MMNNSIEMWIIHRQQDADPEHPQGGYQMWPTTREPILVNKKHPEMGFRLQKLMLGGKETVFRPTFICEHYGRRVIHGLPYGEVRKVLVTIEEIQ